MILACLLANLALLPQDPPHEPTMLERVDALIAKSNAYEGFVARYRMNAGEGQELTMRLAYRSPAELLIEVRGKDFRSFDRIQEHTLDSLRFKDGAPPQKASLRDWNSSVRFVRQLREVIEKEFPAALRSQDLPARESPVIELTIASDNSAMNFSFGVGTSTDARFGWLEKARRRPERVSLTTTTGNDLVLAYTDTSSMFVSTQTGFLTRIEKRSESGMRCVLELTGLDTGARPPDSDFELPTAGEAVQDVTDEAAAIFEGQALDTSRSDLYHTLARSIDGERLKWSDETPAKLERVLRAMHAVDFAPVCARMLADSRARIEKVADAFGKRCKSVDLSDPETIADLEESVEVGRRKLEDALAQLLEQEWTQGMPRGTSKLRPSLYQELGALERRVLSDVFAESVRRPALADFDEKVAKQLEPK